MELSRQERLALEELERRLAQEDPALDAMLSGPPAPPRSPGSGTEPLPLPAGARSLFHVWFMLVMLTCAVLMMGIVLLTRGETSCPGGQSTSCQSPVSTREG
ncbi:DUF3040 domain-containing protein [Nonomuraea sp. NPDC050404]|uniref:DUF3040 domain-containing protein n=1 Tax=Nonomuraea sp. NPDC050404 TaxID=3155783 RepID=UPI0033C074AC